MKPTATPISPDLSKFMQQVQAHLKAMQSIGMAVPARAFTLAADAETMEECEDMRISECADLLISLAGVK